MVVYNPNYIDYNEDKKVWDPNKYDEFEKRDEDGNLESKSIYNEDYKLIREFKYNKDGKLISKKKYAENDGQYMCEIKYRYNKKGELISGKMYDEDGRLSMSYKYDKTGKELLRTQYEYGIGDELLGKTIYDEYGYMVSSTVPEKMEELHTAEEISDGISITLDDLFGVSEKIDDYTISKKDGQEITQEDI